MSKQKKALRLREGRKFFRLFGGGLNFLDEVLWHVFSNMRRDNRRVTGLGISKFLVTAAIVWNNFAFPFECHYIHTACVCRGFYEKISGVFTIENLSKRQIN